MTGTDWKRERLAELRTRIRIEEVILRSLRAELEEIQWLNREAAELRSRWDEVLRADDQDEVEEFIEECAEIWIGGDFSLAQNSVVLHTGDAK